MNKLNIFLERLTIGDPPEVDPTMGACWLFPPRDDGYAQFCGEYVHRFAHKTFIGPIPAGYDVDHRCFVRNCANPDHLEAVTHKVNLHRSPTFQRLQSRKTHCLRGHPFDAENTFYRPDGTRKCRRCDVVRWVIRRNLKRGDSPSLQMELVR